MGRKSRRKAKLRAAARLAQGAPVQPAYQPKPMATSVTKPVAQPKAVAASVQSGITPGQANRFDYVIPELRRIGIISGILFVILFILAFVIH
jgi:hypothetical protein